MKEAIVIEEVTYGSSHYLAMLGWRDLVLRRPLGLVLTETDTVGEKNQRHFVLKHGDALLAGVIAVTQESRTVRLRQMWVRSDVAGQGHGRSLLAGVERIFRAEGLQRIALNARINVKGFYEKCGYVAEGDEFEEIGIPHIRMTRRMD